MTTLPTTPGAGAPSGPPGRKGGEAYSPPPAAGLDEELVTALRPLLREAARTAEREGWEHRATATIVGAISEVLKNLGTEGPAQRPMKGANFFRKAGSSWDVVFEGRTRFTIPDSLGARYLDHLLHHPNVPIPAWKLEQAVNAEKTPRGGRGIQRRSDAASVAAYRTRLAEARAEREAAQQDGDEGAVARLDAELERVEGELKRNRSLADGGERARDSLRKAIQRVRQRLRKGSADERAFGTHLGTHLAPGFEFLYTRPEGGGWN